MRQGFWRGNAIELILNTKCVYTLIEVTLLTAPLSPTMDTLNNHTKYQQLAEILKTRLESSPNGERLPSVRALMTRFKVSQHTVMSALRLLEQEKLISRRHGSGVYRSDTNRLPIIAFCRPQTPSTDIDLKENALLEACLHHGWKLFVHRFDPNHIDVLADEINADAFVLMPEMITFNSPLLTRLVQNELPRVVLGRNTVGAHLDFVTGDDNSILKELLIGLVERGHRRLAFLVSEPPFYEIQERVKSFNQMCQLLNVESSLVLDAKVEYGRSAFIQTAEFLSTYFKSLSGKRLPFTALISCSHAGSVPALRALHEAGISVPQDCSLCCMGSDPMSPYAIPSITNATTHYTELAEACLRVLDQRLHGDKTPLLFESIIYRATWRESTGAAPRKQKMIPARSRKN